MITKDMNITEVTEKYPETIRVFLSHGMHCVGCMAAMFENIGEGAMAHGIDIEKLINDLNDTVQLNAK